MLEDVNTGDLAPDRPPDRDICHALQRLMVTYTGMTQKRNDKIGNVTEEVVDILRQINLEVDSDDVQELMDSYLQELTVDDLIEIHEQEQNIEEL
ncbi:hypothetical protein TNCV_1900621 [Trichonephila clavipes]|nr:hypothetical protein TNCV_1900621 [Trichonephila clavipes]